MTRTLTPGQPIPAEDVGLLDYLREGRGKGPMTLPDDVRVRLEARINDDRESASDAKDHLDLYASPAATQSLLDDRKIDLIEWIERECIDPLLHQAGAIEAGPVSLGPVKVLRDPYSAKPYVLFYLSARLSRPEASATDGDDESKRDAWSDFEGMHLTDGKGYAAADVYARCRAAFDETWPEGGNVAARAAAVAALPAPTPPAPASSPAGEFEGMTVTLVEAQSAHGGLCIRQWVNEGLEAGTHVLVASPLVRRAIDALQADNARLREDAERFRALMRCGRISMQGSSGVDPHTGERNGNNVHFGAEFWPEPIPEGFEEHYQKQTEWGRACIRALADAIIECEDRQALATKEKG